MNQTFFVCAGKSKADCISGYISGCISVSNPKGNKSDYLVWWVLHFWFMPSTLKQKASRTRTQASVRPVVNHADLHTAGEMFQVRKSVGMHSTNKNCFWLFESRSCHGISRRSPRRRYANGTSPNASSWRAGRSSWSIGVNFRGGRKFGRAMLLSQSNAFSAEMFRHLR